MTSLSDSIAVLAATTPPPFKERMRAAANVIAENAAMETQLGREHRLQPLSPARALAYNAELRKLIGKTLASTPAAALPAIAPAAPAAANTLTHAAYVALDSAGRAHFAELGGQLSAADLAALNPKARMQFIRARGRVLESTEPSNRVVAPGHVAVTPAPIKS
jgi:hypothetical protein